MPVRLRLALLFALGTAALIAISGFVLAAQLRGRLEHSVDSGLRQRSALVASVATSGIMVRSANGTPEVLAGQLTQIYDPAGDIIGTSSDIRERILSVGQVRSVGIAAFDVSRTIDGKTIRVRVVPVHRSDGTWVVAEGGSTASVDNAVNRLRHAIEYSGPPAVLLAGLAAWMVAGSALRPVERMRREVAEISELGGTSAIVVPGTHDEISNLAVTMNEVLGRLKRALDRERQFVTDAGHELRTPLTILQAELELAGRPGRSRSELAAAIESAAEEVHRLEVLAEDLLALGRYADHAQPQEPVSVAQLAGDSVAAYTPRAVAAHVHLDSRLDESALVIGNARQLRRAIDNLIDNALQFAPANSEIAVVVSRTDTTATIEVFDQGPGFPVDFLPDAFERFRRADAARNRNSGGAGLGLALVRQAVEAHCGRVMAANRPTGGAWVRIELPCVSASPQGANEITH
jgi:two-component system, OmpR family, sensor kinase